MIEITKKQPKVRFKEFAGEHAKAWEQRKAKDICSISTGKSNTQDKIEDGVYPFYVRSAIVERSNRYLYDEEAILTVGDGVGTGKVYHYVNGKYDLHQRVYRMFDFTKGVTAKYFYHYFSSHFYQRVMSMTAKTSVDSVRLEMISDMKISIPSEMEQTKIAALLDCIDNLIALHQCELDNTKTLKKTMLSNMFPKDGEDLPAFRFAGFTDPWEQRKLYEIVDIVDGDRGINYPKGKDFYPEEHTLFLSATNVTSNGFKFDECQFITEEKSHNMGNGKLDLNDIVLTSRGSIGNIACYNALINKLVPFARINSGMLILRPLDVIVPSFVAQFLSSPSGRKQIDKISFGSAQPQLTKKGVSNYALAIPKDVDEQERIGTFFDSIDTLIALHQRELETYQTLKKTMLEKMFV